MLHQEEALTLDKAHRAFTGTLGVEDEGSIRRWLLDHGGIAWRDDTFFLSLCMKLQAAGLTLKRANLTLGDSHPQILGRILIWRPGRPVEVREEPYSARTDDADYTASPISVIHMGAQAIRRRIEGANAPFDYPVLHDLKAEGATDYVAMALPFSDGSRHFISWASARSGGFSTGDLAMLDRLMPLIALRVELLHARRSTRTLLHTYLGRHAAERVSAGSIRRSEGERMRAIVAFADLRGFTHMTDTLPHEAVIDVLGHYYEAVATPLEAAGADINKLIGDGMLALFPIPRFDDPTRTDGVACAAVEAVEEAVHRLARIPARDLPGGIGPLKAGFGLHVGEVAFGNVGSPSRLDFTAIGPAVNEASRVQLLTKALDRTVLTSSAFADLHCTYELESMGTHTLRGFREAKQIFAVKGI